MCISMTNLVLSLSVTGEGESTIYSIIKDKYLHAVTSLLFTKESIYQGKIKRCTVFFFTSPLILHNKLLFCCYLMQQKKKYKKPPTPAEVNIINWSGSLHEEQDT